MAESTGATIDGLPDFASVPRVAAVFDVSARLVYNLVARGELGSVVIGERSVRIPKKALLQYLEDRSRG